MNSKVTYNFILECLNIPGEIVLDKPEQNYSCGRGKENHIVCLGLTVSRKHCIFVRSKEELYVSDLRSSNGIYINGIKQTPHNMVKLNEDDIIGIGCDFSSANDKNMFSYRLHIVRQDMKTEEQNYSALSSTIPNVSRALERSSLDNRKSCVLKRVNEESCDIRVPSKMRKLGGSKPSLNSSTEWPEVPSNTNNINDETINEDKEDVIVIQTNIQTNSNRKSNSVSDGNRSSLINKKDITKDSVSKTRLQNKDPSPKNSNSMPWNPMVPNSHATNKRSPSVAVSGLNKPLNEVDISPIIKCDKSQSQIFIANAQSRASLPESAFNMSKINPSQTATPISYRKVSDKNINQATSPRRIVNSTPKVRSDASKNSSNLTSNFIVKDGTMIKMEEELQITDNEESDLLNFITNRSRSVASPIKLRKIKQEPKTRFSIIDVVNLSDSEDDIFPCSQLFDNEFDCKMDNKAIKQEMNDGAFLGIHDPDEVILLSDSEGEDNPWLERLSRSQVFNDNDDNIKYVPTTNDSAVTSKPAPAVAVPNESTGTKESSEPCPITEPELVPVAPSKHVSMDATIPMDASVSSSTYPTKSAMRNSLTNTSLNQQLKRVLAKETTITDSSGQTSGYDDSFSSTLDKSTASDSKVNLSGRKPPKVIDPPHLIKGRRKSIGSNQQIIDASKKSTRSSSREKKELENRRKIEEYMHKTETRRRRSTHKWADCGLPVGKGKRDSRSEVDMKMSPHERKALIKEKLKKLTEEKEPLTGDGHSVKRPIAKPKAKVSAKNRGDLLLDELQNMSLSKTIVDKVPKQPKTSSCSFDEEINIDAIRGGTSNKKQPKSKELTKQIKKKTNANAETELNNVTKDLENSLKLNNVKKSLVNATKSNKITDTNSEIAKKVALILPPSMKFKKIEPATDVSPIAVEPPVPSNVHSGVSAQNENCSPNRLKDKTKGSAVKKKVTFCTNIEVVHVFEIDPQNNLNRLVGKDAPIPRDKLMKKPLRGAAACPKIEEFLLRIFEWNPVWLEEQLFLKTIAPVVMDSELRPMLSHYISFEEYYSIALPLLLLETWFSITKDFENGENNSKRPTMMCSIVENSVALSTVPSTQLQTSTLLLEVIVTKHDLQRQRHPNYGDLVFFEYVKNVNGKQIFYKVFAYVTSVHQTILTNNTYFNKDLLNYVKYPHALLTYTIMTRVLDKDIPTNRVQRLRSVTYLRASMRMVQALQYLPLSPLMDLILNPRPDVYQLPSEMEAHRNTPLITKDNLNRKQLEAVLRVTECVVRQEPKLCFIHGPPGTGKSKVVVNIVTQILYGDNRYKNNKTSLRILVCAPSNAAIDEIVVRLLAIRSTLSEKRFKMVRLGRPETMHPSAKHISVTELAKRDVKRTTSSYSSSAVSDDNIQEEKLYLEAQINAVKCEIGTSQSMDETYKKHLRTKLSDMTAKYELLQNRKAIGQMDPKDLQKLQRAAENRVLLGADIITCTLSSCYTNQMESLFGGGNRERISVCIVDEATQSCEAETLIPLMLGVNTLVLVGDPNQLPATILSRQSKKLGLDQSLFSRIQGTFESKSNNPVIMLDVQYRMARSIAYWPNKYFYNGKLKNAANHTSQFPYHSYRVLNLDSNQNEDKFSNTYEAEFISKLIFCIMTNANFKCWQSHITIGILTPYNNQRTLMLSKINEKSAALSDNLKKNFTVEVNTVDSFQGQERDIIIMSCVRSEGIGFLSDKQRLCVALTRAKHSLILCGNFNTFMKDKMWKALLSDAKWRKVHFKVSAKAVLTEIRQLILK